MEIFAAFERLSEMDLMPCLVLLYEQLYWLLAFLVAVWLDDVSRLMEIVYDEKRILPKHAHTLAGKAAIWIIRRYIARRYMHYRILHDLNVQLRHCLYDIWLLLPELRPQVDDARKAFGQLRQAA